MIYLRVLAAFTLAVYAATAASKGQNGIRPKGGSYFLETITASPG